MSFYDLFLHEFFLFDIGYALFGVFIASGAGLCELEVSFIIFESFVIFLQTLAFHLHAKQPLLWS